MASFDLGQEVEALDYDFTTGRAGWDTANGPGKGVIPEPSRGAMRRFGLKMVAAFGLPPSATQAQMDDAMRSLDPADAERVEDAMIDALSEVCQGSPSALELRALGEFGLRAFAGFMFGKMAEASPTQPASGTNGSLALVRSA